MEQKKLYRMPLILSTAIFSLSMIGLWLFHIDEVNRVVAIVGAVYALVCFAFLVFQILAFVRAHVNYDDDIESVKMKVFEAEYENL